MCRLVKIIRLITFRALPGGLVGSCLLRRRGVAGRGDEPGDIFYSETSPRATGNELGLNEK